jgi:phosphoglycolate phosphatase
MAGLSADRDISIHMVAMSTTNTLLSTVLLDLDGTLTDPREGITRCFQFALKSLGRPVPSQEALTEYIGPPLRVAFPQLLGADDEELIESAVRYYRQRYTDIGLFENQLYPGVLGLLASLHAEGFKLYVVTSKPTVYASRIVRHFDLDGYCHGVFGPELDGRFDNKAELIAHVLQEVSAQPRRSVMIGDRATDVTAGKANRTHTMGVTYGFGSLEELAAAEPDCLCRTPAEVVRAVRSGLRG